MRRRLYFVLPDIGSARAMMREMLLARVDSRHIRFLAKRDTLPDDLPDASVLQKTDLVHGAELGVMIGAAAGVVTGILVMLFPPQGMSPPLVTILITAILGALFGGWSASMVAAALPNSRLRRFHADIENGQVLMMVKVRLQRVQEIGDLVRQRHPEAVHGGTEPTIPAFP
jgi:hypothetical protein